MRRIGLVLALLAWIAIPALRAGDRWLTIDPQATRVAFTLDATGHRVFGTLAVRQGRLRFDLETGLAEGEIVLDAGSAETGNKKRDRKMHAQVLESDRYPQFVFAAHKIEGSLAQSGSSRLSLHGTLAIHGDERPLVLPVDVQVREGRLEASGTLRVPYVEWGMNDPSFLFLRVAKVVDVEVTAQGDLSDQR